MKRGVKNILLSLIGFSAAPMLTACYGMPYEEFDPPFEGIKGYVVNEKLEPLFNIEVSVDGTKHHTNYAGEFTFSERFFGEGIVVQATDVDGEANGGEFNPQSVVVNSSNHQNLCIILNKKE